MGLATGMVTCNEDTGGGVVCTVVGRATSRGAVGFKLGNATTFTFICYAV